MPSNLPRRGISQSHIQRDLLYGNSSQTFPTASALSIAVPPEIDVTTPAAMHPKQGSLCYPGQIQKPHLTESTSVHDEPWHETEVQDNKSQAGICRVNNLGSSNDAVNAQTDGRYPEEINKQKATIKNVAEVYHLSPTSAEIQYHSHPMDVKPCEHAVVISDDEEPHNQSLSQTTNKAKRSNTEPENFISPIGGSYHRKAGRNIYPGADQLPNSTQQIQRMPLELTRNHGKVLQMPFMDTKIPSSEGGDTHEKQQKPPSCEQNINPDHLRADTFHPPQKTLNSRNRDFNKKPKTHTIEANHALKGIGFDSKVAIQGKIQNHQPSSTVGSRRSATRRPSRDVSSSPMGMTSEKLLQMAWMKLESDMQSKTIMQQASLDDRLRDISRLVNANCRLTRERDSAQNSQKKAILALNKTQNDYDVLKTTRNHLVENQKALHADVQDLIASDKSFRDQLAEYSEKTDNDMKDYEEECRTFAQELLQGYLEDIDRREFVTQLLGGFH
jgi:hypothetical protein